MTAMGLRSGRRLIEVRGSDGLSWLGGLLTCDVRPLVAGSGLGRLGLIVGKKGKILSDVVVLAPVAAAGLRLDVDAERAEMVMEHLDHHLIMEDVELELSGAPVVRRVEAEPSLADGQASVPLLGQARAAGALIWGEQAASEATEGYEEARFLAGWPAFGVDYDDSFYPQEAGLEDFAVSFEKGCYLGQEVVFMLQARGKVKRRVTLLELESEVLPAVGSAIVDAAGESVGEVKSARLVAGRARVFALLSRGSWQKPEELTLDGAKLSAPASGRSASPG